MANATSGSISFNVNPNNGVGLALTATLSGVPASSLAYEGIQSIATSSTAINLGTLAASGPVMIKNLDPTNFVQIDANTSFNGFPQKIFPGQAILLSPQTITLFGKADTGAVNIQVLAANA